MKKGGKKWRKIQREKEERRTKLSIPDVPKESKKPIEYLCTHCEGVPFRRHPKEWEDNFSFPHEGWLDSLFRQIGNSLYDGSRLCSLIRKSSTDRCHCIKCKTEFQIEDIDRMQTLVQYLKQPDWIGTEADRLAVGVEPVRYIKEGKKFVYWGKDTNYYQEYYEKYPPENS